MSSKKGSKVPFSYQGSKLYESKKIETIIGKNISICEPFLGSGVITGFLGKKGSCIVNEYDKDVFDIWAHSNNDEFLNLIRLYMREENKYPEYFYERRNEFNDIWKTENRSIKRTALFFYLINSSHAGLIRFGKNGFNASYKIFLSHGRNYNIEDKIKLLLDFRSKMKSITNENALDILKNKIDCEIIYCDPPYTNSANNYNSTWSDENYTELIELLKYQNKKYGNKSLVSNYRNDKFDVLYDDILNFSSSRFASIKRVVREDIIGTIGFKLKQNEDITRFLT